MRILALIGILLAITLGVASVAISSIGASRAENSVRLLQSLIVEGKTSGARNAAMTAKEVNTLLSLQNYDHSTTITGQQQLKSAINQVEMHIDAHLDATIKDIVQKYYSSGEVPTASTSR